MSGEFVEQRCSFPIHLHPSRLGNVREGVEEQLNGLLLTFVTELGGVFLAYSDLSLRASADTNPLQCGFIFQERSYIHFSVTVKALTWRVQVGERLEGVVNVVANDHIALLLHGAFNATIPLSGALAPKNWTFDTEKERWIDTTLFKGDTVEGEDADADEKVKAEDEGTSTKKLTKKELKKLERRRLRDVMLAATGRGAAAKQARPPAGVIARGVHIAFEVSAVQHTDDYFKLTGVVVSKKLTGLGLTGGFTPLAPIETVGAKNSTEDPSASPDANGAVDGDAAVGSTDFDGDFDMSALAAVTAPSSTHATPAKPSSSSSSQPAATPSTQPKKAHTDKQQEKYLKKKAKLAERLAAKEAGQSADAATEAESPKPVKSEKKRKNTEDDENGTEKKKSKKVKRES